MTLFIRDNATIARNREPYYVPEGTSLTAQLANFQRDRRRMAFVVDEYGDTLGLVTLEDLVEELIGDLEDEFDRLPRYAHALSGGTWLLGGGVPMSDVSVHLGGALPSGSGSLASFLEAEFGDMPKGGQVLRRQGVEIMIKRVRRGRVFEAAITPVSGA